QNREVLLGQELEHQKKQNYELIVNQIESGIIPHVISDKKEFAGYFVLVFPNGICDVCNKWLFKQISELSSTSDLVVVVPDKLKKNMEIYNTVYNLSCRLFFVSEKICHASGGIKDMTYIFYCSKTGTVLYPLALHHKNIDLDLYFKLLKNWNGFISFGTSS
ncbi:hypothetical protein DW078_19735, partial [Bacteroides fragilis]